MAAAGAKNLVVLGAMIRIITCKFSENLNVSFYVLKIRHQNA